MIPMNKYQTELTEELMNTLPQEVQEQLLETLTTVEFIKRLIPTDPMQEIYQGMKRVGL